MGLRRGVRYTNRRTINDEIPVNFRAVKERAIEFIWRIELIQSIEERLSRRRPEALETCGCLLESCFAVVGV